jgi:DNA-binding NarL/FixJ family response regulator
MERIKVILSHPRVIFREGVHFIMSGEEDFEVAGEATGNREAWELIEVNPPNVAILSQADAKSGGVEITRRIKQVYPSVAVVLITDKNDSEQIFNSLKSGVSALLTADIGPEQLVATIREAAHGHFPVIDAMLAPALASNILADFQDMATLNERLGISMAQLSKKEIEILNAIVSGGGIGQVTAKINLTEEAVRDHLRVILRKLGANDQIRVTIEAAQKSLSSSVPVSLKGNGGQVEYLSRVEFNDFKDSLMSRFKLLVSEKS